MALRKAIGAVKDQTSIGIAKVAANTSPDIEVAVVKATSHYQNPASDRHARRILRLTSFSDGHAGTCVAAVSRRLGKTRDWVVALKGLVLVHRLMTEGRPAFEHEIMYATRKGSRLLNMSSFRDEAHSNSWDHSAFVRTYALYLDQKLELMAHERKLTRGNEIDRFGSRENYHKEFRYEPGMELTRNYKDFKDKNSTPLRDMKPERIFGKMCHLLNLMDRFLSCRPTGMAKDNRIVLAALYPVVGESFKLYADLCEVLAVLLDRFFDMEYSDCVRALDCYVNAAKLIDELVGFYNWCKEIGLERSSEFPEVQRIASKLLETLDEFVRDREKSPAKKVEEPEPEQGGEPAPVLEEIKALPPPEDYTPQPPPEPEPEPEELLGDLVDLREEAVGVDDQENRLALALFAGTTNGSWNPFSSEIISAWQTPAADPDKADWELALVESASNLSKQKATLGGGFDPLILSGIYDQGIVRKNAGASQFSAGSASSVALPLVGKSRTPVLALPAPDGMVKEVGQDPFAASLAIPPPSYVQMADMGKKQQLLVQEKIVWDQYAQSGMQGQTSLAKIAVGGYYGPSASTMMPYGTPSLNSPGLQPTGNYYAAQY